MSVFFCCACHNISSEVDPESCHCNAPKRECHYHHLSNDKTLCPYTKKIKDVRDKFVFDTDRRRVLDSNINANEGVPEEYNDDQHIENDSNDVESCCGCEWFGNRRDISNHIDNECTFVPLQHQILRLRQEIQTLKSMAIATQSHSKVASYWLYNLLLFMSLFILLSALMWILMQRWKHDINETFYSLIRFKYAQINGYYEICKSDLEAFRNDLQNSAQCLSNACNIGTQLRITSDTLKEKVYNWFKAN